MARTIAVSGSASGIGESLAAMLRDAGDTVIGIDLRDADVCADLSVPEGRASAVAETLEKAGGRLDAVVARAGVSDFTIMPVKVNFFGVVGLLEGCAPRSRRPGRRAPPWSARSPAPTRWTTPPSAPAWTATSQRSRRRPRWRRAAPQAGQTRRRSRRSPSGCAACAPPEWAGAGIPLNAIAPGVVKTAMTKPLFEDEAMFQVMNEAVPMPLHGYAKPRGDRGGAALADRPGQHAHDRPGHLRGRRRRGHAARRGAF